MSVHSSQQDLLVPGEDSANGQLRWQIAEEIAGHVCRRYPADVLSIGVHGALAYGDDREGSDIDLLVVTYQPGAGPAPASRQISGWITDLGVISANEYVFHARTLTTQWPLVADRYLHTKAIVDETSWFFRLRDAHLSRLAEASGREFVALAREAWCAAMSLYRRAARCTEWFDTDGALLLLAEARTAAAMVEGLLTRTYFRSSADAGRRTGIGGLDLAELGERLKTQSAELAKRGRPVNGEPNDLFR